MKSKLIKAIGLELADIRRSKNLLITDVANNTNINKDTISKYENGNSSMKIYIIDILLEYYMISINNFFAKVYDRLQNETCYLEQEQKE